MLKCDQTFIDEWSHRWEWHPDSSSHRWEWHPSLFESPKIKEAANKAMIIVKDSALNDRDSTTDKYQETEAEKSKQGHTVKDVYHSHEPGSDLDETDIANTDEIDLGEVSSKDEVNLTILARDEDNNAKKSDLVSNRDTERMSGD